MRSNGFNSLKLAKNLIKQIAFFGEQIVYLIRRIVEKLEGSSQYRKIDKLSEWLDLPIPALRIWLNGMPDGYKYKTFRIPKKAGRGYRVIDAPNHNLKVLQRAIYHKLLKRLNPHKAATAYISGKSIIDNALPHVGQDIVINIDLKDFFGSISSDSVYRYWHKLGWDVETSTILRNICCHNGRLPQGAPTSPALK